MLYRCIFFRYSDSPLSIKSSFSFFVAGWSIYSRRAGGMKSWSRSSTDYTPMIVTFRSGLRDQATKKSVQCTYRKIKLKKLIVEKKNSKEGWACTWSQVYINGAAKCVLLTRQLHFIGISLRFIYFTDSVLPKEK